MLRRRDEQGLVGVILTIVIVWALIAVLELTRTLIAAQDINHTVLAIQANVAGAEGHLNETCGAPGSQAASATCPTQSLPILVTTINTAAKINTAALPLSGQLAQVKSDTGSINSTVTSILQNATSINNTVVSINSLALSIGGTVGTIHSSFVGINADVLQSITPGLVYANGTQVATIESDVTSIKGDLDTIDGQAKGILTQAQEICADAPNLVGLLQPIGRICVNG